MSEPEIDAELDDLPSLAGNGWIAPNFAAGDSIAEAARSIARTLPAAPAQESRGGAAAVRLCLLDIAGRTAEGWTRNPDSDDRARAFAYHKIIWKLREMTTELCSVATIVPPGIQGLLEDFCDRFLPDTLLALRPSGFREMIAREYFQPLKKILAEVDLPIPTGAYIPERFLVVRYPQGEQDNVLMACKVLPYFHEPRRSFVFAASTLGPAYYFALAAEAQDNYPINSAHDLPRLRFIYELMEIAGWVEHPHVGPLLVQSQERFGFTRDTLDRITSPETLKDMREHQEKFRAAPPAYTPADFDRDVPILWERLRQLLPPNELDANTIEAAKPADTISILNAGWSFSLLYIDELYTALGSKTAEDRYEARRALNRLLTKGIELSRIARQWQAARTQE